MRCDDMSNRKCCGAFFLLWFLQKDMAGFSDSLIKLAQRK